MTKTRTDVIAMAHRRIKVLSADETASADMIEYAGDVLDGLYQELITVHEMPFTWALSATPDAAFLPLSYLLATEIAPHYNEPSEPRGKALLRLNAYAFPNDVDDRRDIDDDDVISTDEAQAGLEAAFY